MNEIRFYSKTNKYEVFSNFSWHPIMLKGYIWKTNEHYYQAMKYESINFERVAYIRDLPTARAAKNAGGVKTIPIIPTWNTDKDDVMRFCCLKKVLTHKDVYDILLESEDATLIEDSMSDFHWGCGNDNTGKNMLGKIWMEIRTFLRKGTHPFCNIKPVDIPKTQALARIKAAENIQDNDLITVIKSAEFRIY